jgi:hypothetical protein
VSRTVFLPLAALAAATALLLTSRRAEAPAPGAPPRAAPAPEARAAPMAGMSAPDPGAIRDVFRFAERGLRPTASGAARPASRPVPVVAGPAPAAEWPRLVGLVRRQGRLLAAFATDGEVVLVGPGEEAAGVRLLELDEEGVLVRRRDGVTKLLTLP